MGAVAVALAATAAVTLGVAQKTSALEPAASAGAEPRAVRTVQPQHSPAADALRLPAVAEPYDDVRLFARINGFVVEQHVQIGDRVTRGQVLAVIDTPEVQREYERARAAQAQADARLELASRNLERTQALVAQNFLSEAALDERRADARMAQADRNAAAAEAERLAELLNFRSVRAPFAGVVIERNVDRGDLVAGDQRQTGAHLFRVSRLDQLRIVADAPQGALGKIKIGAQVTVVFPEFAGEIFAGRIARTSGNIDPRSGTMRVEITLPNPAERIPGGMAGSVLIDGVTGPAALLVPVNTVVQRDGQAHIAIISGDRARFLAVRLGRNLGQTVEILEGIDGSEAVILNPNALLREGEAVKVATAVSEGR
jgi:RND family efflux transporter MFP subunit